jgi:hypothetical protein
MEISGTRPAIPEMVGDYVPIYKPQPDVYTGKDTKHYKAGQRYTNWQPNGLYTSPPTTYSGNCAHEH